MSSARSWPCRSSPAIGNRAAPSCTESGRGHDQCRAVRKDPGLFMFPRVVALLCSSCYFGPHPTTLFTGRGGDRGGGRARCGCTCNSDSASQASICTWPLDKKAPRSDQGSLSAGHEEKKYTGSRMGGNRGGRGRARLAVQDSRVGSNSPLTKKETVMPGSASGVLGVFAHAVSGGGEFRENRPGA